MSAAAIASLQRCAAGAQQLEASVKDAVVRVAIASLRDKSLRSQLLAALMSVIYERAGADEEAACFCIFILFELACNNSGVEVQVQDGSSSSDSRDCVLICGFAGSSMTLLKPLNQELYEKQYPTFRRVTAIGVGLGFTQGHDTSEIGAEVAAAKKRQCDEIARSLDGCDRVIVHVLSNFGHGLWVGLLKAYPELFASKLAGCVYDCGADPGTAGEGISSPEQFAYVIIDTIWMAVMANNIIIHDLESGEELSAFTADQLKPPMEAAAHAYAADNRNGLLADDTKAIFDWQFQNEPPVPTLCLTSPEDRIIKEAAVRKFADLLRNGQRGRRVRVASLHGPHCQLLNRNRVEYLAEHASLVRLAGRGGGGAAAEVAEDGQFEFLTYAEVQAKIEEEEADEMAALGF